MDAVSGLLDAQVGMGQRAQEGQVAQQIEHLVAGGFVGKPHSPGVERTIAPDDQRIVEAAAGGESLPEQVWNFFLGQRSARAPPASQNRPQRDET